MGRKLKFVFAAGGTGGHIIPAIAVAEALRAKGLAEVQFVGIGRELETHIIREAGFPPQYVISSLPIVGTGISGKLRALFHLPGNIARACKFYREFKPDLVMGFGGFPSFIPVLAAALMGLPVVLQEQNVKVGLANRMGSLFAKRIFAVPGAHGFFLRRKIQTISNPVRQVFSRIKRWRAPENGEDFTVLVVGGSQGAQALNNAVVDLVDLFRERNIYLIHQTGKEQCERISQKYRDSQLTKSEVLPFIDNIANYYERAHLVICRAGALTVAEVARSGRPAIFVPLPIAGGHQADNVAELKRLGLAIVVEQSSSLSQDLAEVIKSLIDDPAKLSNIASGLARISQTNPSRAGQESVKCESAQILSGDGVLIHSEVDKIEQNCSLPAIDSRSRNEFEKCGLDSYSRRGGEDAANVIANNLVEMATHV